MSGKPSQKGSKKLKSTPKKASRTAKKLDDTSRGKNQLPPPKNSKPKPAKKSQRSNPAKSINKSSNRSQKLKPLVSSKTTESTKKLPQTPTQAPRKNKRAELNPEPPLTPPQPASSPTPQKNKPHKPLSAAFINKQKARLLALKDNLLDTMQGVARDSLRSRPEGSEASAFGMHQADAGSDSYDRDFALSILSQEQDSLYEIDEALKRIEFGTYGICEMSGKPIPQERLEALPFTRYTVECQAELEKRNRYQRIKKPPQPLFAPPDEDSDESDDEFSDNKE